MWGDDEGVSYRVSYQPQEYYIGVPQQGFLKFSNEEKKHLLMAIGALTLAFTLLLRHLDLPIYLIAVLAFCSVMTGFFMHEMAHKYMAQKYGSWAVRCPNMCGGDTMMQHPEWNKSEEKLIEQKKKDIQAYNEKTKKDAMEYREKEKKNDLREDAIEELQMLERIRPSKEIKKAKLHGDPVVELW